MKRVGYFFGLPVEANIDESVGSVTSKCRNVNITVHELAGCSHISAKGRVAARKDAAEMIAHAINNVDALADALESVLKTSRGTSGRIIIEIEDEQNLIAALEAYRGEA